MIETIPLLSRAETVFLLNRALGLQYSWHHVLMHWTTSSKASYSVLNCEIRLFPYAVNGNSTLYRPADVAKFIKNMRQRFPEMAEPHCHKLTHYTVDTTPTPAEFLDPLFYPFRKATPAI